MAGIESVAKAVPLLVGSQRPVMERYRRVALGAVFNQRAGAPDAKQIADSGRVLRIAPQNGLQRRQQTTQPNCGGVGFPQNFECVRMVIRGREAFLIKRQLPQRKQGRADPLVKLIGGNDIKLLCGSDRKQIAPYAPEAQPGLTVAGICQATRAQMASS